MHRQTMPLPQAILDTLPEHVAVLDPHGTIVAVNRAWRRFADANGLRLAGYGIGENYLNVCAAATLADRPDADAVADGVREVLAGERAVFVLEYPCHSPHEQRWFAARVVPLDWHGRIGALVAHENVTARHIAERGWRAAEDRFRQIVEQVPLVVYSTDGDDLARMRYVAPQVEALTGFPAVRWLDDPAFYYDRVHPADRERVRAAREEACRTGEPLRVEYRTLRADERAVWVRHEAVLVRDALGRRTFWQGFAIDVSAEKAQAEALASSETVLRATLDATLDGIITADERGIIQSVNPAASRLFGSNASELVGQDIFLLLASPDRERFQQYLTHYHATGERRIVGLTHEVTGQRASGDTFPAELSVSDFSAAGERLYLGVVRDITARVRAEEERRAVEERYRTLARHFPNGMVFLFDRDLRYLLAEGAGLATVGVDLDFTGRTLYEVTPPSVLEQVEPLYLAALAGEECSAEVEERGIVFLSRAVPIRADDGSVVGGMLVTQNITERKQAEEELRRREVEFRALVEHAPDVIVRYDRDLRHVYVNPAIERYAGVPASVLIGTSIADLQVSEQQERSWATEIRAVFASGEERVAEIPFESPIGDRVMHTRLTPELDERGEVEYVLAIGRDVTDHHAMAARLEHQALHDPLTDLANRALLLDRLEHAVARIERTRRMVAMLLIDIDNFKVLNDSLGHAAGDAALVIVADRIADIVRAGDTPARLSGDEFAIVVEDVTSASEAVAVAERVATALAQPLAIAGREWTTSVSIGIALAAEASDEAIDLLRRADLAMHQAKRRGRGGHVIFDPVMDARALERLEVEQQLHGAIERGELRLHYQPIHELASGEVSEVEALVRWQHPTRGLVPPGVFIPIAEESGLIVTLGRWVLRESCRQARAWLDARPARPVGVSVNLSPRSFRQPGLVTEVERILAETGLPPQLLKLEITEGVMIEDVDASITTLRRLRALGVTVAVDDFGTGYSSLAYLKRFPIDTLKIDRAFIAGLGQNREDHALVASIISTARALGLRVTAEGVETDLQLITLQTLGCDRGQGYLFARPLPPSELCLDARIPQLGAAAD